MTLPSQHAPPGDQETPRFLVFHDTGDEVDYLEPASYSDVARIVRERDPRSIAIGDFDNGRMIEALGDEHASRAVSSWTLGVRWLDVIK